MNWPDDFIGKVIEGDSLEVMKQMPDNVVQTCVTSPPYWGLRDYSVEGQLGLEKTPEEYVNKLVEVFREVRRVLRDDGTLWLNLGDSYVGSWGNYGPGSFGGQRDKHTERFTRGAYDNNKDWRPPTSNKLNGLKQKDLVGIPWRVAFALQADGWYLRGDIIWSKPNPMPESVTDRPTKAHEYIFLMSKSAKYYYDAEAIKEPVADSTVRRGPVDFGGKKGREYKPEKDDPNYRGGKEQWGRTFDYTESCKNGRNKRSVWEVATKPLPEAHYATFPPRLIEPCVLAGSAAKACEKCGAPWERVLEKGFTDHTGETKSRYAKGTTANRLARLRQAAREKGEEYNGTKKTIGFKPLCSCGADTTGSIVLDPFIGSGTTALVAEQKGRRYIGIELSKDYCKMAHKRMRNLQQEMFTS